MARLISRSLQGLWSSYEATLRTHPVRTQMTGTAVLWALGDVLSQKIEGKDKWQPKKTAYAALFGGLFLGPVGHTWYATLDKLAARVATRGTLRFIASKVAVDELLFGPLHVASFFAFATKAEGGSWKDVKEKLQNDFLSAYLAELLVWPAFQTFNFWKVPVRHQLLAVNLATLLDATFLCWVKGQENWLETIGLMKPQPEALPASSDNR